MEDMRGARMQAERVRSEAETRLQEVEEAKRAVKTTQEQLAQKSEMLEAEAQKSIEQRVREAMKRVGEAKTLLPQLPRRRSRRWSGCLNELEGELSGSALGERRAAFLASLKKGDSSTSRATSSARWCTSSTTRSAR